jgi:hypothetical protein
MTNPALQRAMEEQPESRVRGILPHLACGLQGARVKNA